MVKFAFQANRARWGVDNGANEQGGGFIIAIQDGENATTHVLVQCISREALHLQASTPFAKYNVSHIHYWRKRTTNVICLGVLTSWPIYNILLARRCNLMPTYVTAVFLSIEPPNPAKGSTTRICIHISNNLRETHKKIPSGRSTLQHSWNMSTTSSVDL